MRKIEHWHQGSVTSYRILYQDAAGLGGEVSGTERRRTLSRRGEISVLVGIGIVVACPFATAVKAQEKLEREKVHAG
jgi:hypothetical protein